MPITQDLTDLYRGEGRHLEFAFPNPPAGSIAAWTIVLRVKRDYAASSPAVIEKQLTVTVASPTANQVCAEADLSHAEMSVAAQDYVYEIWRTDTGNERILTRGKWPLTRTVFFG